MDLENDIGHATVRKKDKVISHNNCMDLCNLFTQLQCKVNGFDTLPPALEDCYLSEQQCTNNEFIKIIMKLVDIKDDMHVVEDYVLEAIEEFEHDHPTKTPILPLFDDFAASMQVDNEP